MPLNTVFKLKLNFKLKIDLKMCIFKNLEEVSQKIWQPCILHVQLLYTCFIYFGVDVNCLILSPHKKNGQKKILKSKNSITKLLS